MVVNCLNPFFKVDCKSGRILNSDDFKYLARKVSWDTSDLMNVISSHECVPQLMDSPIFVPHHELLPPESSLWVHFDVVRSDKSHVTCCCHSTSLSVYILPAKCILFHLLAWFFNLYLAIKFCSILHSPHSWAHLVSFKNLIGPSLLVIYQLSKIICGQIQCGQFGASCKHFSVEVEQNLPKI